jgi:hypothetical protein
LSTRDKPPVIAALASPPSSLSSVVLAAVMLLARMIAVRYGLVRASVDEILTATGASRSRAYELVSRLHLLLPTLAASPGRPLKARSDATCTAGSAALSRTVLSYVAQHPGCIHFVSSRHWYSDGFRRFVLDLCKEHSELDFEAIAEATLVPLGTLKAWLRSPVAPAHPVATPAPDNTHDAASKEIQIILCAWRTWSGTFLDFCDHLHDDHGLRLGRDLIRGVLEVEGLRKTHRREGEHRPEEIALRGAFRTYFPGAQWIGDGLSVPVTVGNERMTFNVELDVDAHSGAFVGLSVRDNEDSGAVVRALESGVSTTGAPPLALLLDNKPSNHTADVDAALGETLRIRATQARPQNKAHVEGAFGLFSRVLPELVLDPDASARELGRAFVEIAAVLWARASNHRPRKDRKGSSRFELYAQTPSKEDIETARRELQAVLERQELARKTAEARRRPDVLALLDASFARLALLDPERHIRIAIAAFPMTAISSGIAIFEAKRNAKTLPAGVDARYLLGIVKNVAADLEAELFAERLYDLRVELRDQILARLRAERDAICEDGDVDGAANTCVDRALEASPGMERTFWLEAVVDLIAKLQEPARKNSFLWAARRIQATYAVPLRERQQAIRFVGERLVPMP